MISEKKILPIDQLQPGMISSTDVYSEGKVLLAKNAAISESIINKLKNTYIIDKIEVYLNNEFDDNLKLRVKTVEELENTFDEFSSKLENIFDSISTLEVSKIDEIKSFSQKIQNEFNAPGIVIKNILFYGSGNDSIYRHSVNVAAISFVLGKWLGLNENELSLLTYSAILHDFGKLEISKDILDKQANLTPEEYEIFKTHPVISYHFVKQIPNIDSSVCRAILMHHERIDGSGYPLNAKEDKIHKFAKIIAIADLFDDVSSNRYSTEIKGPLEALKIIQEQSLTKLDCHYCTMFLNHIINYFMGENVLLNDKRSCKVVQIYMDDLTKPLLLDNSEFLDLKKEKDLYVEKLVI